MKKLYLLLVILSIFLIGCSKHDFGKIMNPDYEIEYLASIKSIQISEVPGLANVQELVNALLYQHLLNINDAEGFNVDEVKWEINGETNTGTMILVSYKNTKVYLPVIEDGDYIKTNFPEGLFQSPGKNQTFDELYNQYMNN